MFSRLYKLLLLTVVVIGIFFVVSSMTFSGRLAEGKPQSFLKYTPISDHHLQITAHAPGNTNGGFWTAG